MSIIGQSVPRKDATAKVTGKARFIEDYYVSDMLYGYVVRSPMAHARIRKITTRMASKSRDVVTIVTASDIPGSNIVPLVFRDQPLVAKDTVRFIGEPIALIAAETREAAVFAAEKIRWDFEELPAVLSIEQSEDMKSPRLHGEDNVFSTYCITQGSLEAGFNESDLVLEETFRTGYQEHAYLERQGMLAVPSADGGMTVMGSMQCPFYVHEALVEILGIPYNRVRVVQTVTGGAFGGKEDVPSIVAGQAAVLAWRTGRPVKLIYEREEDMISMSKRHPSRMRIRCGVKRDGTLTAIDIDYALDAGAYSTLSPIVLWRGTVHAAGPYRCPNVRVTGRAYATNLVPCGAFRGFGSPQTIFAMESMLDMIAVRLSCDPAELRRRNMLRTGDSTITGQRLNESVGLEQTLEKACRAVNWSDHPPKMVMGRKRYGRGLACFYYGVGLGAGGKHLDRAGADVNIFTDGSVNVAIGNTEMGQGAETVVAQITADALNAPYELISILPADTTMVPDSGPTVASRTTVMSGNAVLDACRSIRERLDRIAVSMLGCTPEELRADNGFFMMKSSKVTNDEKRYSFVEVVREAFKERTQLSGKGWFISPPTSWDAASGHGNAYIVYSYATIIAEVEVDIDTGEVVVVRITSAHDLGKAINPQQAEGQIQGGALQGMSYALMENLILEQGKILNPDFATYILPTTLDTPRFQPILIEAPYSEGPFGAKGLGEPPLMGIAPAIANAIHDAMGIRVMSLPILPERIVATMKEDRS